MLEIKVIFGTDVKLFADNINKDLNAGWILRGSMCGGDKVLSQMPVRKVRFKRKLYKRPINNSEGLL